MDSNPRLDYGRCDRDNVHAFASSANFDIWKGFGAGFVFRAYSGYPINETIGIGRERRRHQQRSADEGRARPGTVASGRRGRSCREVDSRGVAIRNSINGEKKMLLDGRVPVHPPDRTIPGGALPGDLQPGEHGNFGNPTGARNSVNFLKTIVADNPRTAQLGFRLTF